MAFRDADRTRTMWWVLGIGLAVAFGFVVYSFIGTFVFGVFLYYSTRPIYNRLRRVVRPPSLAAAIAMFALSLPALLLLGYAIIIASRELDRLVRGMQFDAATYLGIDPVLFDRIASPQTLLTIDWGAYLTSERLYSIWASLSSAADTLAFVGIGLVHLFIMIAIAFYLLRDGTRLSRWFTRRFADESGVLESYVAAVDRDFRNIFFGNILNAALTGTIGVIAYSTMNVFAPPGIAVPAAALVGLLAGIASLVPVVGMKLVYVPVAIYMGVQSYFVGYSETIWFVLLFVGVSFVIVDTIPDLVLRPYVSGRSLHVGAVMLAYAFGPLLFGWYGLFLLPMLLVLTVHFGQIILPELVTGRPIQPYIVDPTYLVDDGARDDGADAIGMPEEWEPADSSMSEEPESESTSGEEP